MSKHDGMHVFYFREAKSLDFSEELLEDIEKIVKEYPTRIQVIILEPQRIHLVGVQKSGYSQEFFFESKLCGLHRTYSNAKYDEPLRIILLMMKHFMGHNFVLKSSEFKENEPKLECFKKWKPAYYKLLDMGYSSFNIAPTHIIEEAFMD